ncbi:DUF4892 domain-containing protein [Marinobacter sp.]|uniref:DUF4892 domain-containing protein n=1 Tax=Marinobacter sp. TaxID=50741 RepID=UPI00384FAE67
MSIEKTRFRSGPGVIFLLVAMAVAVVTAGGATAETISPFPRATVEKERPIVSSGHLVILSALREVNNEIRSESMVRLDVEGKGQLLQIRPDASRAQARQYYLDELDARNAIILYRCTGRNCGRSNVWANQIFGEARLYGRDEDQDYIAAAYTDDEGQIQVVLVYTVTRGSNREYVWVEQLKTEDGAMLPGFTAGSSRILGPLVVPWEGGVTFQFEYSTNARRQLQEWAAEPGSRVLINSFTTLKEKESVADAMERAQQAADAIMPLLGKAGVSRDQMVPVIIGPAVTLDRPGRTGNRIELKVVSQP